MSTREPLHQELLDILVCTVCRTKLDLRNDHLVCRNCGKHYPVKDGIPDMTADDNENRESGG